MDQADALEALLNNLELLTANPYDIGLHAQNVRLAREAGLEDQIEAALDMVTVYWAVGDYIWLQLIEMKVKSVDLDSMKGVTEVLELFQRAEDDYMSIPLLKAHLEFLIQRHEHYKEQGIKPDELEDMFTESWMCEQMDPVVAKGTPHITQSHILWDMQREYEMEMLEQVPASEKVALAQRIESKLLDRLRQPHAGNDETFQAYSSFTTSYKPPDQYESLLVDASKLRSQAVKTYQRRENSESSLSKAGFSLEAYAYYIETEKRAKKVDTLLLIGLYERAITEADKRRFDGEENAEMALRTFWLGYLDHLRTSSVSESVQAKAFRRAIRSIPGCGEVWARYIRFLEMNNMGDEVDAAYSTASSVSLITKDAEQFIPVVMAKAGYERREVERNNDADGYEAVLLPLLVGQATIRENSKTGDPRLRLERYFSSVCLEKANLPDEAINMWSATVKHYKTSYLAWTSYTEALIRVGKYEEARKVFRDVSTKNIDWPEAVWEAWLAFEHVHGLASGLQNCIDRIEKAQQQVNAKRAKDAEKAARQAAQVAAEQQASVPVAEAPAPATAGQQQDIDMEVDLVISSAVAESSSKRKAEDDVQTDAHKKARVEQSPIPLKRDRENCTVFVADLPATTSDDDLKALFKDCGPIREIKQTTLPNSHVATVEFMERSSVPAALTKDKKRIHDEEVAVHLAWQSTLYVTNFSESADDEFIRDIFGKYGTLFDVRWPSKKFKSSRRFCYVQFTSPESAKAALELHRRELEPGLPLTVYISNPERKKERTDADADDREVYVAGLARSVTKHDLQKVFSTYGTVKDIRMATDDKGQPKGFAFVEFESEKDALAALVANNYELKKRRIAVTLADTRAKKSKTLHTNKRPLEVRNRSVRVRNLPPGTQEGLLQQLLDKHARVQRVEVYQDANEAVVELENPAEAGKLLLHPDPIVFNGQTLALSEESLQATAPSTSTKAPGKPANAPADQAGGLFIPRSAASRPRAGLGSKKMRTTITSVSAAGPSSGTTASSSSQQGAVPAPKAKGQDDFRKMLGGA